MFVQVGKFPNEGKQLSLEEAAAQQAKASDLCQTSTQGIPWHNVAQKPYGTDLDKLTEKSWDKAGIKKISPEELELIFSQVDMDQLKSEVKKLQDYIDIQKFELQSLQKRNIELEKRIGKASELINQLTTFVLYGKA
jgi:hypothetical protein